MMQYYGPIMRILATVGSAYNWSARDDFMET